MNSSIQEYIIQPLTSEDQAFLWEMLYHSLYVPAGSQPYDRSILNYPEIAQYVKEWGRKHDRGFVALAPNGQAVGAVWMRLFSGSERGYGYIDDRTPEIGMAVLPAYRGRGIGTALLSALICSVQGIYPQIALSVAMENPARRLYERQGFTVFATLENSLILRKDIAASSDYQAEKQIEP